MGFDLGNALDLIFKTHQLMIWLMSGITII